MRIWAIADLHLSFANPKPMDIFGPNWHDHAAHIAALWHKLVAPDDVVLLAGDTSWALRLPEALPDLEWLAALPGQKVLTKGNHDYWWDYARKRPAILPASLALIEADAVVLNGWVFCGTRGWLTPGQATFKPEKDERIYRRELGRLERALAAAHRLQTNGEQLGVLLHYPPFLFDGTATAFAEQLAAAQANFCVYGHLHRRHDWQQAVQGERAGVIYHLTSCDFLNFMPRLIWTDHQPS
ncbi:MAG: metallophosphoesterase [Herpetosiphonaceae bacterium]|nr:metallophosphoesterase [Herpetosiphonaceae bacterium]